LIMLPLAEELDEPAAPAGLAVDGELLLLVALLPQAAASSATATAAPSRTGTGTPASGELPIVIIASRAALGCLPSPPRITCQLRNMYEQKTRKGLDNGM
jgi:hypothetical protein